MRILSVSPGILPAIVTILTISGEPSASAPQAGPDALVYCPVSIDVVGCGRIVSTLSASGHFASVSRAYDGSDGTVDLASVDLGAYSLLMVPSLADIADSRPYDLLRNPAVADRLSAAGIGRAAVWSGAPDQGGPNAQADALIRNLAIWASSLHGGRGSPGFVALQDFSETSVPYGWLAGFTPLRVTGQSEFTNHSGVMPVSDAGMEILTFEGQTLAYPSMATFGLDVGSAGWGVEVAARGSSSAGPPVLVTFETRSLAITSIEAPTDPVGVGNQIRVSGTFTGADPASTQTVLFDWGDGSSSIGTVSQDGGAGTFTATRTYVSTGVFTVGVLLSSSDGGEASGAWEYVTIFNPEGEHIIGNGAIHSPPGAFTPDPELSGPATFGFQSRYRRGANAPSGNVQFRFRVGDLSFVGEEQEWLVVSGPRAQFKGRGSINREGDYQYLITAIDGSRRGGGGVDRFRIKIWNDDGIVYDNMPGSGDDADPEGVLTRGRITIHLAGRNTAPRVIITSPADGSMFDRGQAVHFRATADDTEEGDLSESITWTSSLEDDVLHIGSSFQQSGLAPGRHEIRARATDAGGLVGEAMIELTVVAPDGEAGTPSRLAFDQQPTNAAAGAAIAPAVTVRIEDALGNLVASDATVTLALGANPGSGTLSGTLSVAAVEGIATFNDLSIDQIGTGYTLVASAPELEGATSDGFDITVGTAARLAFGQQPTTTAAGAVIAPAVTVRIEDALGNLVTGATQGVTLALGTNPGTGALSGTLSVAAVDGIATFSDLSIDQVGTGYTLVASATGLADATSDLFDITVGGAARLAFGQQPTTTAAGAVMDPAVTVRIEDALGNLVTGASQEVTLALGTNPGTGALSGTLSVAAVDGIATFGDLSIEEIGTGYTLVASAAGLEEATSDAFDITVGAAARLDFGQQPTTTAAGAVMDPAVTVRIEDGLGNLVASNATVTLALGTNPGTGALSGTLSVAAVDGIATFSDLSIDQIGTGYTLVASAGVLSGATSDPFDIIVGAATRLAFGQQPTNAAAGAVIDPAVTVRIEDALGNLVASDAMITLALGTNPSSGMLSGTLTVAAVEGIATFSDLTIDQIGTGYTLVASATELADATSDTFNITVGAAARLAFGQQPTDAAAGAVIDPAVTVRIEDALGNLVASDAMITLTLGTNPAGGALSGTLTVAAVDGIATFNDLTIDQIGTGYTLVASATELADATSDTFNITVGAAARLAFDQQPTDAAAGAVIDPAVTVRIEDALGNLVASDAMVTLALGANPGMGALSGVVSVAAVSGIATFSDLSIDQIGTGYTLVASAGVLSGASSAAFDITVGAAARLAFGQQPTNAAVGAAITPAVTVRIEDGLGNLVPSGATVTLALGTNPGSGTLAGTLTAAAVDGIATFSDLSIDQIGTGYTLVASAGVLSGATSDTFDITVGAATRLAFDQQPTNAAVGAAITPAVTVRIEDALGNLVASDAMITLTLGMNPGTGALSGTLTVAAVEGIATFSNLSIDQVGTGYTLVASAAGLQEATSDPFDITVGAAARLAFDQQPTNAAAGAAIDPAVTVRIEDALGNLVASDATVTLALGANPGSGTLSGTLSVAAVEGIATFNDLSIDQIGTGYTLVASGGVLSGASSAAFDITVGAAARLAFDQQPTNAAAGAAIDPAVTVRIEDALGNLVTGATQEVTLALGTNPGTGALSGTLTVAAVDGIATFSDLSIDQIGTGYTLVASATELADATSDTFNITVGAAARLAFGQQPTDAAAGAVIDPAVTVRIEDALGNLVASDAMITLALGTNPSSGMLSGTLTVAAVEGIATFSDLTIDQIGTGYTLVASATELADATSDTFNITVGAAARLAFGQQPTDAAAGAAIDPAVTVRIEDALGNLVTGATQEVTLALGTNPGTGALSGTLSVAAVGGIATFSDLSIDQIGTGYTLVASAGVLSGATSDPFDITVGAAIRLAFGQQPTSAAAGAVIDPAVTVRIEDALGNLVVSNATVTLALGTNPGSGTLSGTLSVAAVDGIATFGDLSIDQIGTGYTLVASAGVLSGATSDPFDITVGAATRLAFGQQPTNAAAGAVIAPAVTVRIEDALGNLVASDAMVTLALGTNPASGTLSGTLTVAAVDGIATFSDLTIDQIGTGYTLVASAAGLQEATSDPFDITVGAAARLAFGQQPTNAAAGAAIDPAVTVRIEDALGNLVTGATQEVTLALGTNPGTGALSGTLSVAAVGGIATFSDLSIDQIGTGYTLVASAGVLSGATSDPFDITVGAAIRLAFGQQPTSAAAGAAIDPAVTVRIEDALGNLVTGSTQEVTLALGTNPGTGALSGTLTVSAVDGIATFSDLSIDQIGTGYTLVASAGVLSGATSDPFDIIVGAATRLAFGQQPTDAAAGAAIDPAVTVRIEDALGNLVTGATQEVTLALGTNPGSGTLSGTLSVAAVEGIATFNDLSIDQIATGYTLVASGGVLSGASSAAFDITAPTSLAVSNLETLTFSTGMLVITLSEPAGEGGQEVILTSDDPSMASVSSPIIIPEGAEIAQAMVTTSAAIGEAIITASGDGVTGGAGQVTVAGRTMQLLFDPLVGVGRTNQAIVRLDELAPAGGVTVDLSSSDSTVVSVSPISVFVAAGETEAAFTVTGETEGGATITASATGYLDATRSAGGTNTTVSVGTIPSMVPGQSVSIPISLTEPAPEGGTTILLESSDESVATVDASVTILQGALTPSSNPQVSGQQPGTAVISARSVGFAPDSRTATVSQLQLSLSPGGTIQVFEGRERIITIVLSGPAPPGGLLVTLASGNPGFFTVPEGVLVPSGQSSATFTLNGIEPGTSMLSASAPGVEQVNRTVRVDPAPNLNFQTTNVVVGKDLQTVNRVNLVEAPLAPTDITVTVASESAALLSTDQFAVGSKSITFTGVTSTATQTFYVQGLDQGTTTVTAQAAGYNDRQASVSVTASGFHLSSGNAGTVNSGDFTTTTLSGNRTMSVHAYQINANNTRGGRQELRPGRDPVEIAVSSSDPSVGTITVDPVTFTANGNGWRLTGFSPLRAGTTTISITQAEGFAVASDARTSLTATVTSPNLNFQTTNVVVGKDLQTVNRVNLVEAPLAPTDITVTVASESAALLSTDQFAVGSKSITFTGVTSTATQTFYVQGLDQGTTTVTAQAAGYNDRQASVSVTASGFHLSSGNAGTVNSGDFTTTTLSGNRTMSVHAYQINANNTRGGRQELRPGRDPVEIAVSSSDPSVGTITVDPVTFTANGNGWRLTGFSPLRAGTTTISITQAEGFAVASDARTSLTATVTSPNLNFQTTNVVVGKDLQTVNRVNLVEAPLAPTDITVTVASESAALLSTDQFAVGSKSITFTGVTSTATQTFYVQGLDQGTTTVTAQAAGYNDRQASVSVTASGFHLSSGNAGTVNSGDFTTTTLSGNRTMSVHAYQINANNTRGGRQELRPGRDPVEIAVSSSDPSVGTITVDPVTFTANGNGWRLTGFSPLRAGTTTISITQAEGFAVASDARTSLTATVTSPNLNFQTTNVVVGKDLQTVNRVNLVEAPLAPTDITVTVASESAALLSTDQFAVGSKSITFTGVTSTATQTFYVQGLDQGTTTVTAQAAGYNDRQASVSVTASGFHLSSGNAGTVNSGDFTTTTLSGNRTMSVHAYQINANNTRGGRQELRPGRDPVEIAVSSSDPSVGTITVDPVTFTANGNGWRLTGFSPLRAGTTTISITQAEGFAVASDARTSLTATVTDG
jgi:thiamine biosynthesis lipoprotein ApbE